MQHRAPSRRRQRARRGLAVLEEVMLTAAMLPMVAAVYLLSVKACKLLFDLTAVMVGSPLF